jgi:hypothetical protein
VERYWSPIVVIFLLGMTCASAAQAPSIVGTWRWSNGSPAVFAPDGTVHRNGQSGEWERQGNRFVITWFDPKPGMQNEIDAIETVTLSAGGTSLRGTSADGRAVSGALLSHGQITVAAPAANRSAVTSAPAVSSLRRSTPVRTSSTGALAEYASGGAYGAAAAAAARRPAATQSSSSSATSSSNSTASGGSSTPASAAVAQTAQSSVQTAAQAAPQSAVASATAPVQTPTIYITAPGAGRVPAPVGNVNVPTVMPNLTVTPSQVYVPGNSSAVAYATVTWVMANPPAISDPSCVNGPTNAIAANGAPGYMGPIAVVNWAIGPASASITVSAGKFVGSECTVVISTTPTGNWTNPLRGVLTIRT